MPPDSRLRWQRPQRSRGKRIAGDRQILRRDLPLELGRQALAGPARERVGLVVADVRHRRGAIDRLQPFERHGEPLPVALLPVERRVPALAVDRRPAVGEPKRGRAIAAVLHEREPFAVGDEAVGQAEGMDEHVVARRLVVPGEALAVVADLANAAGIVDPAWLGRLGRSRARPAGAIGRPQRIGREQRQDVGQQQLLVLLLVVDADLDQPGDFRLRRRGRTAWPAPRRRARDRP